MTATSPPSAAPSAGRTFLGGMLMGLANLVPGISGGTMILAVGLYDRFIGAVADVTRLRLQVGSIAFLAVLGAGLAVAVATLSGVAVGLVADHRWVMYSLFVGLTLGGVPELLRLSRPIRPSVVVAALGGVAFMAAIAFRLQGTQLPDGALVLGLVGMAAASSMILPGVSGSYVLLILGVYDLVIGSLSFSVWREDPGAAARVVIPVGAGAVLGIGLLSNLLRWLLARWSSVSHGVLLGLLAGSVLGLWPFQEPVNPELADKRVRKATQMVLDGEAPGAVRAKHGEDLDDARLADLGARHAGLDAGDLKRLGEELRYFRPSPGQAATSAGLVVLGFLLTGALGRRERS